MSGPQGRSGGVQLRPVHGDGPDGDVYTVDTRKSFRLHRHSRPARTSVAPPRRPGPARAPSAPRLSARTRRRRVVAVLLVVVLAWLTFLLWVPFSAWRGVERVDNVPASSPPDARGRNYLLVGSDSRAGLTDAEARALGTDNEDAGQHTDSVMLVHVSEQGNPPVIVSIPRDSYVPIPGRGSNKINSAYSLGGAKLLTQTVEQSTGLPVDGYLEVGFVGFAGIVDSLGGVEVCVPTAMKDAFSGLDVQAGCQTMDGKTALAYVRTRYADPRGDIGRAERQRQFLAAVFKKAASPATVLLPWRYTGFADAASKGLVVGDSTSLVDAVRIFSAMRDVSAGNGISTQVPVETVNYQTRNGVAVKWNDRQARSLFATLREDQPVTAPNN